MSSTVQRGRLPAARRDKRPTLALLAVLLILLGALGSALVAFRSGDRTSVLVAARDIPFGTVVNSNDFVEVLAAADTPGMISASRREEFIGLHTTSAIPEGALVNPKMFTVEDMLPPAGALVGLVLDPTRRPDPLPAPGQVVRVYFVAGEASADGAGAFSPGDTIIAAARVVSVGAGASADSRALTLLVNGQDAGTLANYASSGNVAVALLPNQTRPPLDTVAAGG